MTITGYQLFLYALGMAGLWVVPGPVWVALTARALSGGFAAAWPLAIGVAIGDLVWPLAAILGLSWIESVYGDVLSVLRWVAAMVFIVMGYMLIRKPAASLSADIALIIGLSGAIPMAGNLGLALFLDRARALLSRPEQVRKLNLISGCLLVAVGLVIPFL